MEFTFTIDAAPGLSGDQGGVSWSGEYTVLARVAHDADFPFPGAAYATSAKVRERVARRGAAYVWRRTMKPTLGDLIENAAARWFLE